MGTSDSPCFFIIVTDDFNIKHQMPCQAGIKKCFLSLLSLGINQCLLQYSSWPKMGTFSKHFSQIFLFGKF